MDEVIEFDQFKEIPERPLIFDRAIEVGDHPGSEGELDKLSMSLEAVRGEDLSLKTEVLLDGFEVSLRELSLRNLEMYSTLAYERSLVESY